MHDTVIPLVQLVFPPRLKDCSSLAKEKQPDALTVIALVVSWRLALSQSLEFFSTKAMRIIVQFISLPTYYLSTFRSLVLTAFYVFYFLFISLFSLPPIFPFFHSPFLAFSWSVCSGAALSFFLYFAHYFLLGAPLPCISFMSTSFLFSVSLPILLTYISLLLHISLYA